MMQRDFSAHLTRMMALRITSQTALFFNFLIFRLQCSEDYEVFSQYSYKICIRYPYISYSRLPFQSFLAQLLLLYFVVIIDVFFHNIYFIFAHCFACMLCFSHFWCNFYCDVLNLESSIIFQTTLISYIVDLIWYFSSAWHVKIFMALGLLQ